jgi:hypothetical protein
LFQLIQTAWSKRRRQNSDKFVTLAIIVIDQRAKRPLSKLVRGSLRCLGHFAKITAHRMEDTAHDTAAVIAARKHRIGERHESPHQFEAFGRVRFGDLMNRTALRFEIIDQGSPILPVNEGSGPGDSGQPLANFLGDL